MKLILGVTGSISAFKAVEIMRLFQKKDHQVSVILTESAQHFIPPLTFETFAPGRVHTGMFSGEDDVLTHINICKENELLLIAPATANIIGKIANGIADDLLSSTFLAFNKRVVVVPAMNSVMFQNIAVQENIQRLKSRGIDVLEPDEGSLACNTEGKGRLPSPESIVEFCLEP